ncbi:MAG: beta-propeller domain-containing protein [Bacilli bacterium]
MEFEMNNILNLMIFVGFLGFLVSFAYFMMQRTFQPKIKIQVGPLLGFLLTTSLLLVGTLTPKSVDPVPLQRVGINQVQDENHLRSLLQAANETRGEFTGVLSPGVAEDSTANSEQTSKENSFVDTNSQVAGVKEGDVVKTDGEFIYYASRWDSRVRVMTVDTNNVVEYVTTINLNTAEETVYTDSMYLTDQYLIIIGYRYNLTQSSCAKEDENGDVYFCADFVWWQPTGSVMIIDRATLNIVYSLQTDAAFIDHRIVPIMEGDNIVQETLFLVGHYYFYSYQAGQELRPSYIENDGEKAYMPYASMTYINEDNLYAMTTLTGIPLRSTPEDLTYRTSGYLGTTPDYKKLYVNFEHLYLAQSNYVWEEPQSYQTTTIMKFDLEIETGDLTLVAVGTIRGVAVNQFALDEFEGNFRIATTDTVWDWRAGEWWWSWENRTVTNRLYILSDLENGNFGIVALIEEGLGKPGESIMSVRFQEHLAYVVTFLRTDPLYIIDLSDPLNPEIREEIVLPGFDTYQHPWGDGQLIGLGYDANEEGQITGMKLSAYSTAEGESDMIQTLNFSQELLSDMSDQEGQVWGWSWAEALWDHKAITVSVEHGIFAFAVNAYSYHIVEDIVTEENEDGDIKTDVYYDYTFTYHSYYFVFKIDFNQEEPISLIEKVEHPSSELGYVQVDRGVMINQVIHTLSNQQMISYDFTSDSILQTLVFPEYQQA